MNLLQAYVIRNVVNAYGLAGFGIAGLFWLLELLERLESGVDGAWAVAYVAVESALSVPEAVIGLLPVISVLATAIAMGRLQTLSELNIMRVSGVSIWRLAGLAMVPGLVIAVMGLAVLQWGLPNLYQQPERIVGASLGESGLWHPEHGLWLRQDNQFLNVADLELGRFPVEIDIYRFSAEGQMAEHIAAKRGLVQVDGQWLLSDVITTQYQPDFSRVETERLLWSSFLSERQLGLLLNPPASLSLTDLWQYVAGLKAREQPHAEFELVLWQRLAMPLACVAMILAAMATAAVPLKSRVIGVRIVGALVLGLSFQLLTELGAYLGLLLNWPAVPVALGPPALLIALSAWLVAKAR